MTNFSRFIIILKILLVPLIGYSCMCGWYGGILKMSYNGKFVIHGKVSKYLTYNKGFAEDKIPLTMEVEILEIIKGEESKKKITIWGDNGIECRPYLNRFPVDSEWIFVLQELDNGDYVLSICGEFFAPVKNRILSGKIIYNDICSSKVKQFMTIEQLKGALLEYKKYIMPKRSCYSQDTLLFEEVNKMPKYYLGRDSLFQELKSSIGAKYDELIGEKENEGDKLFYDLIIDKDGTIFSIKKNYALPKYAELQEELLEVIKGTSGFWIPGSHHEQKYRVKLILKMTIKDLH